MRYGGRCGLEKKRLEKIRILQPSLRFNGKCYSFPKRLPILVSEVVITLSRRYRFTFSPISAPRPTENFTA